MRVSLLLLAAGGLMAAEPPGPIALTNARIVTGSGPVIQKGTVVLRAGRIEAVGANAAAPTGAQVIDLAGMTVYPGLIDALAASGDAAPAEASRFGRGGAPTPTPTPATPAAPPARGPEDRPSTTSWLRAADQVKPADARLEALRNAGFTNAVVFPQRGVIAGQGAVVSCAGETAGKMVIDASAGQYVSFSSGSFRSFPGSLMGVLAYIRQTWMDATWYHEAKAAYEKNPTVVTRPAYDRALEGVLESKRVLLPAVRAYEIERTLRFAAELKTPAVLYGGHEAAPVAAKLQQAKVPVLLSAKWPEKPREGDPEDVDSLRTLQFRANAPATAAALKKAGVPFAIYSDGLAPAELFRNIRMAMTKGLSAEDALAALTSQPAAIYGLGDRLGTIEKGKMANLTITDGDLFGEKTRVRHVFIEGVKYTPPPPAEPAKPEVAQ
ncbi:MAG: amidohydrolase family protein [Bryobacter sp.]|nr:amidohydrolase family protein [Bryobacter sp.]